MIHIFCDHLCEVVALSEHVLEVGGEAERPAGVRAHRREVGRLEQLAPDRKREEGDRGEGGHDSLHASPVEVGQGSGSTGGGATSARAFAVVL